jgi:hypothetical protein
MKKFFDKISNKPSATESAAAAEQRRQDEAQRQRDIITGQMALAKSPEGQKWREDLRKKNIAEIERDITLRENYLRLFNKSSGETDPELLKLKRDLEDIKKGNTTSFEVKLSELRNANPSASMSMPIASSMSMSMPMSMPRIPDNYDPFKPYKPKQRATKDVLSRNYQTPDDFDESKAMEELNESSPVSSKVNTYKVPDDFDESKAMEDLNDEDFDGGKRNKLTKRRKAKKTKKTKKTKKSRKSKKAKKCRK